MVLCARDLEFLEQSRLFRLIDISLIRNVQVHRWRGLVIRFFGDAELRGAEVAVDRDRVSALGDFDLVRRIDFRVVEFEALFSTDEVEYLFVEANQIDVELALFFLNRERAADSEFSERIAAALKSQREILNLCRREVAIQVYGSGREFRI